MHLKNSLTLKKICQHWCWNNNDFSLQKFFVYNNYLA